MVKKLLCSLFSAFAMSFALNVSAQTFYAGLSYSSSSDGCIYSFDLSDVSANTGTVLTFPYSDSDGSSYLLAGTTVENSYYGFLGTDWGSNYFASINFETGAVTRLATTNVATVRDMTYDPVSKEVYCLQTLTTSSGANSTKVFTLDIATGDTATYFTIEGMAVEAIAADGTGKAYALGFVQTGFDFGANAFDVALYTVDFAAKTCEKLRDLGEFAGSRNYNSLVLNEGTLYYIGGNQMLSINPAEGGMVTVGKLPSSYLSGLTFTKSTENGAASGGQDEPEGLKFFATSVDTYGDAMGQFRDDVISKRLVTFYDQWNNPVREAQYGRQVEQYSDNPWVMQYFTKYDYNEAHQLVSKHSEIVQEYVRGEYYYKSNNDTVNYEYDAEGRLAKETTVATGAYITYEYDEEGQLVKTVQATPDRFMVNGGNPLLTTTTYSNFAGFNLPQMIVAEGHYSTTYTTVEYDAAGHKTRSVNYADAYLVEPTDYDQWTWRNDSLVEYTKYNYYDGEAEATKRTVYECVDGNPLHVRTVSYYYSSGKWRQEGLAKVTNYSLLDNTYTPAGLTVTPVEGKVNTATLSFAAPSVPVSDGEMTFDIYRHGQFVATVRLTDEGAFDSATGMVNYTDSLVPNGDYEYMVQTVIKDDLTGDSTALNVSDIVSYVFNVDLPTVTNIHGALRYTNSGADVVTVAWDAPADVDPALGFQYYNIYVVGLGQANADDAGQIPVTDESYDVTFADDELDIFVQSVYALGRVNSDTTTIVLATVPTGINDVAQDAADGKVSVSSSAITVDGVAQSIAVFNAAGALQLSCKNASRADISALQGGVYVAIVTVDGKSVAVKFTK